MRRLRLSIVLVLVALAAPGRVVAQTARLIPVGDPAATWIARLQERGYLASLHPTVWPKAWDEVAAAVEAEHIDPDDPVASRWLALLTERLGPPVPEDGSWLSAELRPGVRVTSNGRLDPARVLDGGTPVLPWGTLRVDGSASGLTVSAGVRHDLYWDRDPDGLDSVLRLYMRSHDAYVGYRRGLLMVHLGRHAEHWGAAGGPGLLLSDHPRPADGVRLRLGGGRLALRSTFAELDAVTADGRFTGTAGADSVSPGAERRWLAAHRLDWRPSNRLALTLAEAVVFSGVGSGFSLKYLNPAQPAIVAVDNRPKNDENNGLLAVMLWWRPGRLVISGQAVLDDFDFLNGDEPTSAAASASVVLPAIRPAIDAGATLTAVTARAYSAHQAEGRYVYLGRGMGAPFADYVRAEFFLRWHADELVPDLAVIPALTILWQGEHDYRLPWPGSGPGDPGTILTGIVERTVRAAVVTSYDLGTFGRLELDAGIDRLDNASHVEGRTRTLFVVTGGVSLRIALSGPYRLGS